MRTRLQLRITTLLCMLSCLLLLSGCWDMKTMQNLIYPIALGIDYKNNQYEAYVQTANFSYVAKTESGTGSGPKVSIGKSTGKTVGAALASIVETSQRRVYWSNVRCYVFTASALKAGGTEYFDTLKRYRENRYTPWVFGTRESLEDILKAQAFFNMSPMMNITNEPEDNYRQRSMFRPIMALEYQVNLNEPGRTTLIPILSLAKKAWQTETAPDPKLKISGMFIISEKTFKGGLAKKQLMGLRWMDNHTERTPVETKSASLSIDSVKHKISYELRGGKPFFTIKVKAAGNNVELNNPQASEKMIGKEAEQQIASEIRRSYLAGLKLGVDLYSFKNKLFQKKYPNWNKVELDADSLAKIDVSVYVQHEGNLKRG
ncbi:Ger(x)C family spore germination protein [Paenibacillus albus]|uniref:Ger(X)C family spore germination protein n=1 Tax=Paenibacillus albus TaxID=2495582 RepID=A0A3Q8X2I3_9BACL|nr:Ger(x)C family spore germination protein [Paenibacillus albus]AZN38625.1 Ger(x)C family spore germination protein [Paenibacillus albus]